MKSEKKRGVCVQVCVCVRERERERERELHNCTTIANNLRMWGEPHSHVHVYRILDIPDTSLLSNSMTTSQELQNHTKVW